MTCWVRIERGKGCNKSHALFATPRYDAWYITKLSACVLVGRFFMHIIQLLEKILTSVPIHNVGEEEWERALGGVSLGLLIGGKVLLHDDWSELTVTITSIHLS